MQSLGNIKNTKDNENIQLAKKLQNTFNKSYPGVKQWQDKVVKELSIKEK